MILRPYYYDDHGCAAYVLGCGALGRCAVVDARIDDVEAYATFAGSKGMRITHVIDTHVHADPGRARENAAHLYTSLHEKLLTLPGDVEIFPGHFSGSLCGAGLSGKPTSTIAFERRWNPMLSLDRESFIEAMANVPAKPEEMEEILSFNRGTAQMRGRA